MLMAACAPQAAGTAVGAGTSPTPALATATQAPPTETPIPVTPTPAGPARPQYTLDATMYYTYKVLTVHETIVYPNRTGTTSAISCWRSSRISGPGASFCSR
jgi:hypothetical protein